MSPYAGLLQDIERRLRERHTGRVMYTVYFREGGIRELRVDELKRVPYLEPVTAGREDSA